MKFYFLLRSIQILMMALGILSTPSLAWAQTNTPSTCFKLTLKVDLFT